MISRIRAQLGHAGFVVAIVALVAALGGGAYAASGGGLTGKQKKEVEKIAKKFAGEPGPAGQPGAAGANGKDGANGTNGTNGKDGTNGTNGKSVTIGATASCTEGGISIEVENTPASKKSVCNGAEGPEGSPWTAGGTLPSGATETGTFYVKGENKTFQTVPIGWPIPLTEADAAKITTAKIHVVGVNGGGTCTGSAKNPTAPPGELCMYKSAGEGQPFTQGFQITEVAPLNPGAEEYPEGGVNTAGALIYSEETNWLTSTWVQGTFAITAP